MRSQTRGHLSERSLSGNGIVAKSTACRADAQLSRATASKFPPSDRGMCRQERLLNPPRHPATEVSNDTDLSDNSYRLHSVEWCGR